MSSYCVPAPKERASALRATQSITRTTSATSAQSKLRDAQRHEEQAVRHDRQAAQNSAQMATKRRSLSDAQRNLERAETMERKKQSAEADRQRRDELRQARIRYQAPSGPIPPTVGDPRSFLATADPDGAVPAGMGGTSRRAERSDAHPEPKVPIQIARLPEETNTDAVLELSKAAALGALAVVPVLGPVLRELIGTAWGDNRADRLHRFATALGRNVEDLQDRIDEEFVKNDEFEALAEETLERVVQRRNEQKIARFAAAVVHSATTDRPEQHMAERFLDWLDSLRPIHVQILSRLASGTPGWARPPDVISPGQVVQSRLFHALEGLGSDRYDLQELERRGLIGSVNNTSTLLAAANDIRSLLTPIGGSFLAFITGAADAAGVAEVDDGPVGPWRSRRTTPRGARADRVGGDRKLD